MQKISLNFYLAFQGALVIQRNISAYCLQQRFVNTQHMENTVELGAFLDVMPGRLGLAASCRGGGVDCKVNCIEDG